MSNSIEKHYERSQQRVAILEKMIEDKTREVYLEHQKVEKSNLFLSRILGAMSSGVLVVDENFAITIANDAARQVLRREATDLVGQMLWNVFSVEGLDNCTHRELPVEQTEGVLKIDSVRSSVPITYAFSVLENDLGEVEAVVCLFQDLTTMKSLERQLLQAQKLESVGQLAAGIAHEINTPIQYVRDNTVFVREEFERLKELFSEMQALLGAIAGIDSLADKRESLIQTVEDVDLEYLMEEIPTALNQSFEGAESVARIVRSMKTFSHPGSDEKSHSNLNQAIESTVTVSKNEWKYVSEVKLDLDDSLPLINCYPGELNQVFLNLLVNAAHAISDDTDAGKNGKGLITVSTRRKGNMVEITVTDSGTGITDEVVDKIFDPFFTTKQLGKGTGQGLAIVYSTITERHNGTIECETKIGVGTTFRVSIPLE